MKEKLAIIGSGISGLVCTHLLSERYDVSLFEANQTLGGHTNTVSVSKEDGDFQLDTGFIVFNERTYPNFCRLMNQLSVPYEKTEMSFSYSSVEHGLEYNPNSLNSLFGQRRNMIRPSFYKMLGEIIRFNKIARTVIQNTVDDSMTLADFFQANAFSVNFKRNYLLPMMSAIWSTSQHLILSMPVRFLFEFFGNHGLLNINKAPTWSVISGGSKNYIQHLLAQRPVTIYKNTPIKQLIRNKNNMTLQTSGDEFVVDKVILATHSDQALTLLNNPTIAESEILSAIPYQANEVVLHTDSSILPKKQRTWASWNYYERGEKATSLTYYMNRLQNLRSHDDFCVSVNLTDLLAPEKIINRYQYAHPVFTAEAMQAQKRHAEINGLNNTYFCGAYWGYGFHEDGVNSALKVCRALGVSC